MADELEANRAALEARRRSPRVVDPAVRRRAASAAIDPRRAVALEDRANLQQANLGLPPLPTTTIGSFPQTAALRTARASWRAGRADRAGYEAVLRAEIDRVIALQEELGLDVLVHGEPERDDMVRYFAEQLSGFVLSTEGWVQSYGSRCVRPPVLFGDVARSAPMPLEWARYARSRTAKPVKGMLTGPITMLRWSFVRDDLPEAVLRLVDARHAAAAQPVQDFVIADKKAVGVAAHQQRRLVLRHELVRHQPGGEAAQVGGAVLGLDRERAA